MPKLLVFAGPNGSGKSTVTSPALVIGDYINADLIKRHLGCKDLEAAEIAENTREYCLARGNDFTFETVLSTPRNICLMQKAKESGYYIICVYVLTCNPQINVKRVQTRVAAGGHGVSTDKIVSRYKRALQLFPKLLDICNELYVFDNSVDSAKNGAEIILQSDNGETSLYPTSLWNKETIESLIRGDFVEKYID